MERRSTDVGKDPLQDDPLRDIGSDGGDSMDENLLRDAQAEEALPDEELGDEEQPDGMQADGDESCGQDVEKLRRLRLNGFLRELVRQEGRTEAAKLLGVNYKTVVRAEQSGHITEHVSRALEGLLGAAEGAEMVWLRERVGALEDGMETLAKELRGGLDEIRAAVAGSVGQQPEGEDAEETTNGPEVVDQSDDRETPPVPGIRSNKPFTERRLDAEVVTEEPAGDDPGVYGPAWPLVEEWRRLRAGHPNKGRSMTWLATEERLLTLELAMLEEHGLTLPPETQPLRGFGRRGQTTWRRAALDDTRRALGGRRLLRWVRRVLTLGLW